MSPRVIQLPMSGGDRKHYVRELKRAQARHPHLLDEAIEAYARAHRLACQEWNVRQFIGGEVAPSPTIGAAIDGGYTMLKVICRACGHSRDIDLNEVIWPVKKEVHTLPLRCAQCGIRRPNMVELYDPTPEPQGRPTASRRP